MLRQTDYLTLAINEDVEMEWSQILPCGTLENDAKEDEKGQE